MRKYYQAALVVIATVSLVSLLFYRHEYNKLRYVLEVFNYFGKPNQKNVETNCTDSEVIFSKIDMKFDEPFSSWQRLTDDLYIYSAYNIYVGKIQAVAFGSPNSVKELQCETYFRKETKPTLGTFSYVLIDSNANVTDINKNVNYKGYHFYCTYIGYKVPVGVTFSMKSNTKVNDIPVLPIKNQLHRLNNTKVGLCVTPPVTKPMHPLQMISFINFHDTIGMDNFIVYDFGIPNEFTSNFKDASKSRNPYWKFTYTNVPWNFPFPDIHPAVIKDLIQADCLYRTYNKIMYIATLSWEEYIALRYHHTLVDLMTDLKRSRMKADRYRLKTLTLCTQQADSATSTNITYMIFKKVHFDSSIQDDRPTYIYNTHEALRKENVYTKDIANDLVSLNRYKYCAGKSNIEKSTEDTTILRFAEDVYNSQMFRKFVIENKLL